MQDRQTAVAGMFYPEDPTELTTAVKQYLQSAAEVAETPKAIIVPHAGYIYSGPVAGSAYASLLPLKKQITRVVLLGPSHRIPLLGMATSSADRFLTPLGAIEIDKDAVNAIQTLPHVHTMNEAHTLEHSLEVQLPFLQLTLDDFKLVPVVVGDASASEVAAVLDALWGGPETLIVISSDLSHYHDYQTAQTMDSRTSAAIEALNPEDIQYEDACGRNPVKGLLAVARQRGIQARTLDLRNSGDTAGSRDQVVGYGAYLFYQ